MTYNFDQFVMRLIMVVLPSRIRSEATKNMIIVGPIVKRANCSAAVNCISNACEYSDSN